MQAHTPGPWSTQCTQMRPDNARRIDGPDGMLVAMAADFNRFDRDAESDANARLIAAAPDLLACLEDLCEGTPDRRAYEQAEAAIRKARGA